jgi:DNA anti-recombination protein RmuC
MKEQELKIENEKLKEKIAELEQKLDEILSSEERTERLLQETKQRCEAIEEETRKRCAELEELAEQKIDRHWKTMGDKLEEFFQTHEGFREWLKSGKIE